MAGRRRWSSSSFSLLQPKTPVVSSLSTTSHTHNAPAYPSILSGYQVRRYAEGGGLSIKDLLLQLKAEKQQAEERKEQEKDAKASVGTIAKEEDALDNMDALKDLSLEEEEGADLEGSDLEQEGFVDDGRYSSAMGRQILDEITRRKGKGKRGLPRDAEEAMFYKIMAGEEQKMEDFVNRKTPTEIGPAKLRLEDLKYFYLMNKRMRQWILHIKTPRGYFNSQGR